MSAHPAPALDSITLMLSAALDRYESDVAELLAAWPDTLSYTAVSSGIDMVRQYSNALPQLSLPFVMLLIAHAELIQFLWCPGDDPAQGDEVRATHNAALRRLRQHCHQLIASSSNGA
jgi:hypothetical protein